jgi:hypothetical protein
MFTRGTVGLVIAAAVAGCSGTTAIRSVQPRTPQINTAAIRGAYAPSGTRIAVRLDQSLSTETALRGQTFTARLLTPVRANDGRIIAREGATVAGVVAGVRRGRSPIIEVEFTRIDTDSGPASLTVAVRDADRVIYRGDSNAPMPSVSYYQSTAVYTPTFGGPFQYSNGPADSSYGTPVYVGPPREVRLDRGATLQLQLTRPLIAPGGVVLTAAR